MERIGDRKNHKLVYFAESLQDMVDSRNQVIEDFYYAREHARPDVKPMRAIFEIPAKLKASHKGEGYVPQIQADVFVDGVTHDPNRAASLFGHITVFDATTELAVRLPGYSEGKIPSTNLFIEWRQIEEYFWRNRVMFRNTYASDMNTPYEFFASMNNPQRGKKIRDISIVSPKNLSPAF